MIINLFYRQKIKSENNYGHTATVGGVEFKPSSPFQSHKVHSL